MSYLYLVRNYIISGLVAVVCSLVLSSSAFSCELSIEDVSALDFGEYVKSEDNLNTGWVRIELDGTVVFSSRKYALTAESNSNSVTSKGHIRLKVENVLPNSSVNVKLDSKNERLSVVPGEWRKYFLLPNATSGYIDVFYGGQLVIDNKSGKFSANIEIDAFCEA